MIFRTLLFFVVMYFLVKLISRVFLEVGSNRKRNQGPGFFYQVFKQYAQQNQQQNPNNRPNSGGGPNQAKRFEEIEEAEFEEITDDEETTSKSSE